MEAPLSWLIGGPQGAGVDTAANLFGRACASAGFYVFGKREYYSNIMGKHSYFEIRIHAEKPVHASTHYVHILSTFDEETPFKHFREIVPRGAFFYDPAYLTASVDVPPNMERRLKEELKQFFQERNLPSTLEGVIEYLKEKDVFLYPIDFNVIFEEISRKTGVTDYKRLRRMKNTIAVAASMQLIGLKCAYLCDAVEHQFKGRQKIVDLNCQAVEIVYEYMEKNFTNSFPFKVKPPEHRTPRLYIMGTQAVALGKIAGGLSVQTYYPISPATDESVFLEQHENIVLREDPQYNEGRKEGNVVVVQTEDEISAVTAATGAAIAGARAATATSGPGFCLMVEGLGWAGINEVPLVVTLYQRGGPSTGLPTRTEQGDLWFALFHGHGEYPRVVLASGDHEECFYDAIHALNWAEQYQLPVIHLIDKYLANSTSTIPLVTLNGVKLYRGAFVDQEILDREYHDRPFERFADSETGISPRSVPGQKYGIHWATGDEHDTVGHITEDPVVRMMQMEKRMRKLDTVLKEVPDDVKYNYWETPGADTLVVSWGSNKGVILELMEEFKESDVRFSFLQIRLIWPFDSNLFVPILKQYKRLVGVELNFTGQLCEIIQMQTGVQVNQRIVKYTGRPFMIEELKEGYINLIQNNLKRVVVDYGI